MKDFEGKELNIGDEVIFIKKGACGSVNLERGKIGEIRSGNIYINQYYRDTEKYENPTNYRFHRGVKGVSIYKI